MATNQESVIRFAQRGTCCGSILVRHAAWPRWCLGRFTPFVIKFEFNRTVLSHVLSLSFRQSFEASSVLIDDVEAVGNFIGPETKVRDMACELVRIQSDEASELRRQFFGDGNCVCREGSAPFGCCG